jgi:predicted RNA-binding protein (virulence factor B family)
MSVNGKFSTLKIDRVDDKGAWIKAGKETILLPKSEMPYGTKAGDQFNLFVYQDASDRLVATRKKPKALVGDFCRMKVKQISNPGAFLDWGLEKDLLVPHREQFETMKEGRWYLVKVCLDSWGRVVATSQIETCLEMEEIDLKEGEEVDLLIWQFTPLGCKVIINNLYSGLLYKDDAPEHLQVGDRIKGYVKRIRNDKKIDVSRRVGGKVAIDEDKAKLLEILEEDSFLPLHDGSSPEEIKMKLGMSKKAFKKAVGGLYKARLIKLEKKGISLVR